MKIKRPKTYFYLVGLAIFVYIFFKIDRTRLMDSLSHVDLLHLFMASLFLIPIYLFKALRWKSILKNQNIKYSYKRAFLTFTSSNFIAFITPGRIGEFAKALYVSEDTGVSISVSLSAVIVDRIFDVIALLSFCFAGYMIFLTPDSFSLNLLGTTLGILALLFFSLNRFILQKINNYLSRFSFFKRILAKFLDAYIEGINRLTPKSIVIAIFYTICAYLALFTLGWLLGRGMKLEFSYLQYIFFIAVANVLSFLPIAFAGLGTREASFIYLFSLFHVGAVEAVAFSVLIFAIFYIFGGLIGFLCFSIKPLSLKKIKKSYASKNKD